MKNLLRNREDHSSNRNHDIFITFPGFDPKSSIVPVAITVMNKHTPIFSQPFYSILVPENIAMHSAILSVEANSPSGKKLIYSISEGNVYGEFAVDFNTGRGFLVLGFG